MKGMKRIALALLMVMLTVGMVSVAQAAPKLNKKEIILIKGQTQTLKVTGTKETVKWSSNKKAIAAVSSKGVVTAKKKGTATITAKAGKTKLTCKVTVEQPKLSKAKLTLNVKNTYQLKVTGTKQTVKWTTSAKKIAVVNKKGLITAKKKGTVTITAKIGTFKIPCKITDENAKLSKTKLNLTVGKTAPLKLAGTTLKVTWASKNKKIATVTKKGVVKAVKAGTTEIIAKTSTGEYICAITVEELKIPISSVSLNKSAIDLVKGGSETLEATYAPKNTTDNTDVIWSSSDTSVVKVKAGKISAVGNGTATITAKISTKEASCKVTVTNPLTSVSLDKKSVDLIKGGSAVLQVSYAPLDTSDNTTVTWTSSNPTVAVVNGGTVLAVGNGTTTITANIAGKEATCSVTVTTPLSSISLDKTSLLLDKGEKGTLQVSYYPLDTTDDTTITWESSDESIVSVNNGFIEGIIPGSATITATIGQKSVACNVVVNETYGSVVGDITYYYNNYRGNVADTDSVVILVNKNGLGKSAPDSDSYVNWIYSLDNMNKQYNQYGIFCANVSGTGSFSIQNVPTGDYVIFVRSKNTTSGSAFDDKDNYVISVRNALCLYMSKENYDQIAEAVGYQKFAIGSVSVVKNQSARYDYDFGITYI